MLIITFYILHKVNVINTGWRNGDRKEEQENEGGGGGGVRSLTHIHCIWSGPCHRSFWAARRWGRRNAPAWRGRCHYEAPPPVLLSEAGPHWCTPGSNWKHTKKKPLGSAFAWGPTAGVNAFLWNTEYLIHHIIILPRFFQALEIAHPEKDKWISSPSHFSSFFTV